MAERVLGELPDSPGRVRFAHALIRDTLYDELTAARRLQLHAQAGEALEAVYAADAEGHLAELAHHFAVAAPAGTGAKALEYATRAGDRATAQLAHEEAVRLYEMALGFVTDEEARCDLLLALGDAQARAGDTPGSKGSFREAAEIADRLGLGARLARAALGYGGRIIWEVSRDDPHLVPLLERGLEVVGDDDPGLRVRLLARLAGGPLREAGSPDRRVALSVEALDLARAAGDPSTIAYALSGYIAAHHSPDHTSAQFELATEQIETGMRVRRPGACRRGLRAPRDGAPGTGRRSRGEGRPRRDGRGSRAGCGSPRRTGSWPSTGPSWPSSRATSWRPSRSWSGHATSAARAQSWNAVVSWRLQLYVLRREQGRLDEIEALVRRSLDEYPTYTIWGCVLAHTAAALGLADEARERVSTLVADDIAALPFDEEWLVSTALLVEAASLIGHGEAAAVLHERLLPYADRVTVSYPEISVGFVSRYLGLAATTLGRHADAERHFEDSLESHERTGARSWLAHTRHDYARALLARGRPGDRPRAEALLAEAVAGLRGARDGALGGGGERAARGAGR